MTASLYDDAIRHHVWATARLLDACGSLTPEQLATAAPGTYGSILETFRHLVVTDCWYLTFFRPGPRRLADDADASLEQLRGTIEANGEDWMTTVRAGVDGETDTVEHEDGWEFTAPVGLRLAQVVQHGTDHRSQICTARSSFGMEPPVIDLWAYGEATGRTRAVRLEGAD